MNPLDAAKALFNTSFITGIISIATLALGFYNQWLDTKKKIREDRKEEAEMNLKKKKK